MKHLFFINPAAGKRDISQARRQEIVSYCAGQGMVQGRDFEVRISKKPGDITRWTREAAATGENLRVYACGGDGTLNEVVNGAAGCQNVSVTHFPNGSGNDFIKIFSDVEPFSHLSSLMEQPEETTFDLIECNGMYALNTCSLGLDARIGNRVATYKRLPFISGGQAYMLSALVNTIKGIHHHYRIELNGQVIDGRKTIILACNGRWYGGGFQPVPEANPADGLLDILLVEKVSRLKILQVIGPYKQGRHRDYPELIQHYRTDCIRVFCDQPEEIGLDGEMLMGQEVQIRLIPGGLKVFYPRGLTWSQKEAAVMR